MNSSINSINETFIIESLSISGNPTFSACTALYSDNIISCTGNAEIILSTGQTIFNTSILPFIDNTIDLGSISNKFANIIGTVISATTYLNLPLSSGETFSGGTNVNFNLSSGITYINVDTSPIFNNLNVTGFTSLTTISATTYLNLPQNTFSADTYWTSGSTGSYNLKTKNDTSVDTTGNYAIAMGWNSIARGVGSFASGGDGTYSGGTAIGGASHAEGIVTTALGNFGSHAEGDTTTAFGDSSHSEGAITIASGYTAHAEGYNTTAQGDQSHSEGYLSIASGQASHAEGFGARAQGDYSHAEGSSLATGQGSHAEGVNSTSSGYLSHAEGHLTIAGGDFSHSEGSGTTANGGSSHSEGELTFASGIDSHAEGLQTQALGDYSHSEGNNTNAIGSASHAEGNQAQASGANSHAEGLQTNAVGNSSHSEGFNTTSTGNNSHAGGNTSQALGETSFVHGNNSIASAANTNVFGANITATTTPDTTYVDNLNIKTVSIDNTLITVLARDINGFVKETNISSALNNYLPITGGTLTGNLNVLGDAVVYGSVQILGTASTFNTQVIQAEDNNIHMNYSGSHLTANGGGVIILSGISNSEDSSITIDAFGNWSASTSMNSPILSATTYLNLPTDIFVTGGTVSRFENLSSLVFTNNSGNTFTVSNIFDTFITGGTFDNSTGIATFTNNSGNTFNINGFDTSIDTYITGFTYNNNLFTISSNTGSTFSVLANQFSAITSTTISATTYQGLPIDIRVTGGTYSNGTTIFTNNTGGTFSITGLFTGATDVFVTGGTPDNTNHLYTFTNNTGGTFNVNGLVDVTTTAFTYNNNLFSLTNSTGGTLSVLANQFSAITSTTISATTYLNLPTDIRVTGGTYSSGTAIFTNNTGGTFNVTGFLTGTTDTFVTGFTYSNNTFTISSNQGQPNLSVIANQFSAITSTTISATTYQGLPIDIRVTGATYTSTAGTLTFTNNTGGTFTTTGLVTGNTFVTGFTYSNNQLLIKQNNSVADLGVFVNTMTGLTVNGSLSATSISANTVSANTYTATTSIQSGIASLTSLFTGKKMTIAGNSADSTTSLTVFNQSISGITAVWFGESDTNVGIFGKYGSGVSGNFAGTSIPSANTALFQVGNNFQNPFSMGMSVLTLRAGNTATNYGSRLDSTGFRIDQIQNLHTTNLNSFTVNGKSYLGGNLTSTAILHLASGTTSASTAPLKFTSGSTLTITEAGAVEYNGTNLFITPNNGIRNIVAQVSGATALTSGRIPFATTNGYLKDSSNLIFDGTGLTVVNTVQYVVPTTGQAVSATTGIYQLVCNPAGTLLALTINFPTNPLNGQQFSIAISQIITTLTLATLDGSTIDGTITTSSVNSNGGWVYVQTPNTWFKTH